VSYKSTRYLDRASALAILLTDAPNLSNDLLGDLLDLIADSGQSHIVSRFDNFIVSEVAA
jgi:hypothetical protein